MIALSIFIFIVFLIIYHHFLYPFLLKKISQRRVYALPEITVRHYTKTKEDLSLPDITLIIPAYNEATSIAEKIRNLAAQDYPAANFTIRLLCDGCTDSTVEIAQKTLNEPECQWLPFIIEEFTVNRGKIAIINDAITNITSPIVAFSDVSALLPINTFLTAAAHFKHADIGVVGPGYRVLQAGSLGESHYWQYQSQIKQSESSLNSVLGMHGACYFIRRECLNPIEADTINDDFILPMNAIAQGYRAVYEPRCLSLELETASPELEAKRRKRIAAGNTQQIWRLRKLLHPRFRWNAFNLISGKGLRVLMPFCLLTILLLSLYISIAIPLFIFLFIFQFIGYISIIVMNLNPKIAWPDSAKKVQYLVNGHWYNFIGTCRYLLGREKGRWKRANQQGE
ncbi:MAG: glycosyltransferase family 2 protein [Plesiomonas sp.]|uniref:glycosyltransferase family 2 protein n=1 Tax=Plesiomonas sp. TaxID=2486279 RepID=UPI003F2E7948